MHLLPLYSFFNQLRKHPDFTLGIADYQCLLSVLEKQPDKYFSSADQNRQQLLRLCKLLWLKPNHSTKLFEKLFETAYNTDAQALANEMRIKHASETIAAEHADLATNPSEETGSEPNPAPPTIPNLEQPTTEQPLPKLYLNFQESKGAVPKSGGIHEQSFLFEPNYFPYQWRQLQQVWRFMKNPVNSSQTTNDIDIKATIAKLCNLGFLLQPVFRVQKQNSTSLVTLIDHKGSMVAFKNLAKAIAQSARLTGIDNSIYYFRNVPQTYNSKDPQEQLRYVYENVAQTKHIALRHIFENKPNASVLIISDTGTGSIRLNGSRKDSTKGFLEELYSYTLKVAWLNPMPQDRWGSSLANTIRELTDMFEATPQGLKKAIAVLKGKNPPRSAILFPEHLKQL